MFNRIIKLSIYLLVFLLPILFLPFSFEAFEFNKQYLLFFLVSLAFFSWLAKMILIDKKIRFKKSPLDFLVLVFLAIAVLSAVFSIDKGSSIFGFYGRFSDGLIGLLSLGIFYFLITNNVEIKTKNKKPKIKTTNQELKIEEKKEEGGPLLFVEEIFKVFLWSVFFVILLSYFSVFGVWGKLNGLSAGKFSFPPIMLQTAFNPSAGSMEGLSVFLAVVFIFLVGKILTPAKKRGGFVNYLFLVLILGLLIFIDFTAAWIIISAGLFIFLAFALWKRLFKEDVNKLLPLILVAIIAVIFIFVDTADFQSFLLKFQLPREQILEQGQSWIIGLKSATENIKNGFLGSGVGTFSYGFSKFRPAEFNQSSFWQVRFDRAGNYIAEILGTMGFLGILSYFFLIGFFLLIGYSFLQQNKNGVPLFTAFLGLLVSQFVYYQNTILAFTFWFILALSAVSWQPIRPAQGEKTISFKDFPELSLIFSMLLIILGLAILGTYFFAGKFYLADIGYKEAIGEQKTQKLEKAVNLNPCQPQYKIVLARDYLSRAVAENQKPQDEKDQTLLSNSVFLAITYGKGGQIDKTAIKGATELTPNRVAAWETLGMIYRDIQGIATGALEWAIKSFEKAITLEPTNPVLHTELGKLYSVSGDKERGRAEFEKAKELKPDYVDSSIQIALIYESENNLDEAVREMESLVSVFPFNVDVLFQLGRFYFNSNRIDEAILQFERIIIFSPNHSNAHYSLGVAYQKNGKTQKAIVEFEKVLELNPGNTDVQAKLDELKK